MAGSQGTVLAGKSIEDTVDIDWFIQSLSFLLSHQWIYDFPVTRFFVEKVWVRIPEEWRGFLLALSVEDLNLLPYGLVKEEWPASFATFIKTAMENSLGRDDNSVVPLDIDRDVKRGMKPKKIHEVSLMAACIHEVMKKQDLHTVVDVGAGLGYLGQVLQKSYGYRVIALECDSTRTHSAEARVLKQVQFIDKPVSLTFDLKDDPVVASQFGHMIKDHVVGGVCMVGLHCCGDLTPTMLRYFTHLDCVSAICTVSCCYHRMEETDMKDPHGLSKMRNFPMSQKCKEAVFRVQRSHPSGALGTHALRLAAQETRARWKNQTPEQHSFHKRHVAYRGLLELLSHQDQLAMKKLTRKVGCKRNYQSFEDYLDAIFCRVHLETEEDQSVGQIEHWRCRLHQLYIQNEEFFQYIEPITALQVVLQPVLETLIYYDRLVYLQEQGIQAYIQPLFDEFISPRNLVLVGMKQQQQHRTPMNNSHVSDS